MPQNKMEEKSITLVLIVELGLTSHFVEIIAFILYRKFAPSYWVLIGMVMAHYR